MKRSLIILFIAVFLCSTVLAETLKIDFPVKDEFEPGEKISLRVSLFDKETPVDTEISLIFSNAEKTESIEKLVLTNKPIEIDLGENASSGYWNILASYDGITTKEVFFINTNEEARFEVEGDKLIITNIGNTYYSKMVHIIIGDTPSEPKRIELGVGEKTELSLMAPTGTYKIKVTDGETTLVKSGVSLTGESIGFLPEKSGHSITIGNSRNFSLMNNAFVYVFLIAIIGVTTLLAIERHYKKKQ